MLSRDGNFYYSEINQRGLWPTVTEGLWKAKPVIGGNTGGIRLQIIDHHTGFLVSTPEGAALRIRYLMRQPGKAQEMAIKGKEFVRHNFLITRHLREYLSIMVAIIHGDEDRVEF